MTRRATHLLLATIAVVIAAALSGCGGGGSGSGLDDALSYVPKNAELVFAVDTDTDGDQYEKLDKLISKFPFGGQVKGVIKQRISQSGEVDYDKDVKPLLGNDLVFSVDLAGISKGEPAGYLMAWKTEDEDVAKRLAKKDTTKVGSSGGADIYRSRSGDVAIGVKDSMLLVARTKEDIEAAVKRADGDDHMTEDSFNERLGDLDKDALVRVTGDIRALFAKVPNAGAFAKQKWLASLRTFGAALLVEDDGISYDSEVKMEGLAPEDLPIAEGEKPAQVVRRAGEVGFGVRNPAQTLRFYAAALGLNPITARQYSTGKAKLNRQLGIDIDRDVIDQLTGDATGSVSLTGGFAFRAQVADPASAKATLAKVAKRLPKLAKRRSLKLSKPKGGDGFYGLSKPGGDQIAFGIVGENFVLATDPARAAQFAGQSASDVADTKGAIVLAADAGAIAKAIGAKQGQAPAAQILASSLGDLVGSVEAEPGKITSHYKLNVK